MVSVKLKGRLGNQMFQIAAAVAYAMDMNDEFALPVTTMNEQEWPHYFRDRWAGATYGGAFDTIFKEPSHAYSPIPKMGGRILLDGYFQSYKYFSHHIETIRDIFGGFGNDPTNDGWVALHVRRGDYLKYPDKHPVITLDYIRKAVKHFRMDVDFLIFTDDMRWCEKNLGKEFWDELDLGDRYELVQPDKNPMIDLRYMSMSEHFIVANSSFSVMAALLSPSFHKKVVCPDESCYFGPGNRHLDVSTLMPTSWTRIKF